jgi:hypothetical protein
MNALKITPLSFYVRLQATYDFRVVIQQDFVATNRACRNLIRVYDQERKCDGKVLNSVLLQRSQQLNCSICIIHAVHSSFALYN